MFRPPNPIKGTILGIGLLLSKLGVITEARARRTTELAWPRIVTGLARMSKNAVDVAMVGIAVGGAAIAGVGIAGPFWGLAFSLGAGIAAGTIALVSQRYGAGAYEELGRTVRASTCLTIVLTIPIAVVFFLIPERFISLISSNPAVIEQGTIYLKYISFGIPFGALNLVGGRILIGANDAYTAMVLRAGGAVANILLNAVLIFGLGMGVMGAAIGTVLSNALVTVGFAVGLTAGRAPIAGTFPVTVDPHGTYLDVDMMRDVIQIGVPVIGRSLAWTLAELPMFGILDLFGQDILSAYVIARRIWGLMNTPGWGFGLASSSLIGQELGVGAETTAEAYGREIMRFAVAVYLLVAVSVALVAEPIVLLFVDDPTDVAISVAVGLVYAACAAAVIRAVADVSAGALDGSGDTRWTFMAQMVGMFGGALPLVYLGATTSLGVWGLYLAFFAEATIPAVLNYYRFNTGRWKEVARAYRPEVPGVAD